MESNLNSDQRARLEYLADEIELVARSLHSDDRDRRVLFMKAFDIKQIARRNTLSAGI